LTNPAGVALVAGVASVKVIHNPVKHLTEGPSFTSIHKSPADAYTTYQPREVMQGTMEATREADLVVVAVGVPNLVSLRQIPNPLNNACLVHNFTLYTTIQQYNCTTNAAISEYQWDSWMCKTIC
jgi:hypothetical protein